MHNIIRIAHVSDLHLGVEGATAVWRSLRGYLTKEIRPDLVVVTGDVVDTPDRSGFENARTELDALGITYKLCPGNHDRHPLGNAPSFLGKLIGYVSPTSSAHSWFDQVFGAAVARPEDSSVFSLARGDNRWRLRVAGFDTSAKARHSAQGFAELANLNQLTTTLGQTADCDLVIVLLHHHLLPIAELEEARQKLRNLLAPTIMLNAGTLLERLARGNVNLVLHGHEHHRAVARYGTLAGSGNDVGARPRNGEGCGTAGE